MNIRAVKNIFQNSKNLLKDICEKYHLSWQFVKFLFVGFINTVFAYSIFSFFIFIKLHYAIATLLAQILGILFNFKTTGGIVFKNSDNNLVFKFFVVYGFMYFVTVLELKIFTMFSLNNMYINYALIVLPNAMISYMLMKCFVFKK
ncbi:MAG TPA: polysaccharide biosynthesis protein GtrA [Cyanobacteria bacterium UBA11991]|nr:GtrA family protein [Cyanobacteriota bacterium]HCB11411.1 polysaccharide biosynthesis protein GtrA [Cyanobacteria bacterium UBA11991]